MPCAKKRTHEIMVLKSGVVLDIFGVCIMSSITVYQFQVSAAPARDFNDFQTRMKANLMLRGSKAWDDIYWKFFTPVATVHTACLDSAFEIMNLWNAPELVELHAQVHSLSVGDILKVGKKFFMVEPCGFEEITIEA